jgi:hypothetical protein
MDPHPEGPTQWKDFHPTFIQAWREAIADRLPSDYFARVGEDVVMIGPAEGVRFQREPDVLISKDPTRQRDSAPVVTTAGLRSQATTLENVIGLDPHAETFIEIIRLPDQQVVTVLELLSPTNKSGEGRGFYYEKRLQLRQRRVHLFSLPIPQARGASH